MVTDPRRVVMAVILLGTSQAADMRFFGSTGTETHLTPANGDSPLNPGDVLRIERMTDSSDITLFGEIAPDDNRWKLQLKLRGSNELRRDATSRLDVSELNWKVSVTPWLDIRAGRKIERWGTGYAWNPTGVVNPRKNPADPGDRRNLFRGVDMVSADLFVKGWNVTLIGAPEFDWRGRGDRTLRSTGWAARAYRLMKGADVAFTASGGNGLPNSLGLSLARVFGNALELHGEAAYIDDTVRLLPRNGGLSPVRRPHLELLLGGQYTFPRFINVVGEYYRAGHGLNAREWRDFGVFTEGGGTSLAQGDPQPLALANSQFTPLAMSKDYGFVRVLWPIRLNRLEVETIVISSLRDGSSLIRPGITWRIHPNWSVYCIQSEFLGNARTEFGHIQIKRSSELGIRYHFSFGEKSSRN